MSGQTVTLSSPHWRSVAKRLVDAAPFDAIVNIKAPSRSTDQNALLWTLLSQISLAKPQGRSLPPEVWKALFMNSAGFTCTFEPSLDGKGVVPLGFKSSRLNKAEFSDLLEAIYSFAAEHEIPLGDDPGSMNSSCMDRR